MRSSDPILLIAVTVILLALLAGLLTHVHRSQNCSEKKGELVRAAGGYLCLDAEGRVIR